MIFNSFVTQLLAEEIMADAMRQAEQTRLVRAVGGSGKARRRRRSSVIAASKKAANPGFRPRRLKFKLRLNEKIRESN